MRSTSIWLAYKQKVEWRCSCCWSDVVGEIWGINGFISFCYGRQHQSSGTKTPYIRQRPYPYIYRSRYSVPKQPRYLREDAEYLPTRCIPFSAIKQPSLMIFPLGRRSQAPRSRNADMTAWHDLFPWSFGVSPVETRPITSPPLAHALSFAQRRSRLICMKQHICSMHYKM